MKLQSNNLFENLTNKELESLIIPISETVAKDYKTEKKRIFSAADLWAIQRRKKDLYTKRLAC